MILSRQVFNYQAKPLIEKVKIKVPFRYEAIFPNEGCFLYVMGSQASILSSEGTTAVNPKNGVLLKCGNYFVDWVHADNESVDVIAFHLDSKTLSKLYQQEIPQLIKDQIRGESITRLVNVTVIEKFIENLQFYFDNPMLVNEDVLELKIKELILLLLQSKNASTITELLFELFSPQTIHIKEVVAAHIYSDLSIAQLARLSGLSVSSFKKTFEKFYGQSPNNYLLNQRIKKSCELLETTSQSISQIAFATGFNDPAYFARLFKKRLSMTPSDYRLGKMS